MGYGHTRPETAGKTNVEEADLFFDSGKCGAPGGMLACKTLSDDLRVYMV